MRIGEFSAFRPCAPSDAGSRRSSRSKPTPSREELRAPPARGGGDPLSKPDVVRNGGEDGHSPLRLVRRDPLFGRDDLLRALHGFNPWWSGRKVALPAFRRPVHAACRRHLEARSSPFVLLLSGLRGAGKSTLLLQLAADLVADGADPRSILYLGMGHPVLSRVPLSDVLELYRDMVHPKGRPACLLLDAMHYAREWDREIKQLLQDESGYRIIATESVQMIERALVTETQFGRWRSVAAPSLSFYEHLALRGHEPRGVPPELRIDRTSPITNGMLQAAAAAMRPTAEHFGTYLASGGLPWLAARSDAHGRSVTYEDLAETILRRDVSQHFGPRNVDDLKRLFVYVCMRTGDVLPVQRYARAIDASTTTVVGHLDVLERCFLVRRIDPVGIRGEVVQKARRRVFVADTTLRNAQLLRDSDHFADDEETRRVVATSLVRHVVELHARSLAHVGYWRDARSRRSVDLVVRESRGMTVFDPAPERGVELSDKLDVVEFCRIERVCRAFLVTSDPEDVGVFHIQGRPTEFVRAPAHLLAYLLGREEAEAHRSERH